MTMTIPGEALMENVPEPANPAEPLSTDLFSPLLAAERLGGNAAMHTVWQHMIPLLDGGEQSVRFAEHVPETPLVEVPDEVLPEDLRGKGHRLYLAADGHMPTGAYKFRGAEAELQARLTEQPDIHTVTAGSTGNHAAAVALTAALHGLRAVVYMPKGAVAAKVHNTEQYGAEVRFASSLPRAMAAAKADGAQSGAAFIHPYDLPDIIAGQGTGVAAQRKQLAAFGIDPAQTRIERYDPVGGGGNASGRLVAARIYMPEAHTHLVRACGPEVDGAYVQQLGALASRILQGSKFVHGKHTPSLAGIGEAMAMSALLAHELGGVAEPAGAMALAAALEAMRRDRSDDTVRLVQISGINTTAAKVHKFAATAYESGTLTGTGASALVSTANLGNRRPYNELEQRGRKWAAQQTGVVAVRAGCRIVSGR